MQINYKYWYITRDDNGFIQKCAVRFYEGDVSTQKEPDPLTTALVNVRRFRRTKKLQKTDMPQHQNVSFEADSSGSPVAIYTSADLGAIKDDDELSVFLNKELNKDTGRETVDEQKEEDLVLYKEYLTTQG